MSLKVALWCPHGRDGLPLAARLFLEQLPRELVGWSSDSAEATNDASVVAVCDLAIVLCPAEPPAPPAWRGGFRGRVLILPGTSAAWSDATVTALGPWGDTALLVDVLPDECENAVLRSFAFETFRPLFWLPALAARAAAVKHLDDALTVVDLSDDVAALSRTPLSRRLLLHVHDPVAAGLGCRVATEAGAVVGVLGNPGSVARRVLLGAELADHVGWTRDPSRAHVPIRATMTRVMRSRPTAAASVPEFSWEEWARAVADACSAPRGAAGKAACFLPSQQRAWRESGRRIRSLLDSSCTEGRRTAFASYPELVSDPAAISELARCEPSGAWFQFVWSQVAASDAWVQAAQDRMMRMEDLSIARLLWYTIGDSYVSRTAATVMRAIGSLMAARPYESGNPPNWSIGRALVLGATGHCEAASEELDRQRHEEPQLVGPSLAWVLRAWAPALEAGEAEMLPRGAAAWWLGESARTLRGEDAALTAVRIRGELWLGDAAVAGELISRFGALSAALRNELALAAWMSGAFELARQVFEDNADTLPANPEERLSALAARALCGAAAHRLAVPLLDLGASCPDLFAPERPSHGRALLLAQALHHAGEAEASRVWRERACQDDLISAARAARFLPTP